MVLLTPDVQILTDATVRSLPLVPLAETKPRPVAVDVDKQRTEEEAVMASRYGEGALAMLFAIFTAPSSCSLG